MVCHPSATARSPDGSTVQVEVRNITFSDSSVRLSLSASGSGITNDDIYGLVRGTMVTLHDTPWNTLWGRTDFEDGADLQAVLQALAELVANLGEVSDV